LYDGASPIIKSTGGRYTLDNNSDGTVDYVKLVYSEAIEDSAIAASIFCVSTSSGTCIAGDLTESYTSTVPSSGNETDTANDASIYIGIANGTQTITVRQTNYTLAVQVTGTVTDNFNLSSAEGSATNSADGAGPILLSASPTAGGVLIPATESFTMTFSEDMENTPSTSDIALSTSPASTPTYALSESSGVVTVNPSGATFAPGMTVTITLDGDGGLTDANGVAFNEAGTVFGTDAGTDATYTFTTLNPSSSGGGGGGGGCCPSA